MYVLGENERIRMKSDSMKKIQKELALKKEQEITLSDMYVYSYYCALALPL